MRRCEVASGKGVASFFVGVGIGVAVAFLFAPRSGEETREIITERGEDEISQLKRKGRDAVKYVQDAVDQGERKFNHAVKTSRDVLNNVASKLE
jgi:gas vesicle protein